MRSNRLFTLLGLSAIAAGVAIAMQFLTPEPPALIPPVSPAPYAAAIATSRIARDAPEASARKPESRSASEVGAKRAGGQTTFTKPEAKALSKAGRKAGHETATADAPVPTAPVAFVEEEIELTVPAGAPLPLVLVAEPVGSDPDTATDKNANRLLDSLAVKFAKEVARSQERTVFANEPEREERKQWQRAATDADEQYRAFFGQDAYMEKSLRGRVFTNAR